MVFLGFVAYLVALAAITVVPLPMTLNHAARLNTDNFVPLARSVRCFVAAR